MIRFPSAAERRRRQRRPHGEHWRRRWSDGWQPGLTIAAVLLGLVLVWGLTQGWHRYAALWLIRSTPAVSGRLVAQATGPTLVWRSEQVLRVPYAGTLAPDVADGTFVSGGQVIARVGDQLVRAPQAGQVWFSTDGWEAQQSVSAWAADPQIRAKAEQAADQQSAFSRRPVHAGQMIPGGGPVGVLVDPFTLRLVVWLPARASGWLPRPGSRGAVEVAWNDGRASGRVEQVEAVRGEPGWVGVVVSLANWPAQLARRRFAEVTVDRPLTGDATLITGSALWVHGGELGVFVLPAAGGRRPIWFPVQLRGIWSPHDQVAVTYWQGRLYPGGLGSGQPPWTGPDLPVLRPGQGGPYRWSALQGPPGQVRIAVNGVPAGARVVTNPGWVANLKLYL